MKIFVTGASGFIGSHLTRKLIEGGYDVLVLATPDANFWRIKDIIHRINILRGVLQDISGFQDELHDWRPEVCIHLAWFAEPGKYLNSLENLASLQGSLNLLQALANCGCRQFIGAGTCAEYEIKHEKLKEDNKTKPQTLYGASKLSFQLIGEQIALQTGLLFTWGRIFYLYGTQEDTRRIIPSSILSLQNGKPFLSSFGEQIRDYLHVQDVADAFITLLEKQAVGTYNICSAAPISIRFILDTIGSMTGQTKLIKYGSLPYREWEPKYICGNNKKLKELGWKPKVSLQEGLKEMITWLQNEYTKL